MKRVFVILVGCLLCLSGCAVPTSDSVDLIAQEDLPENVRKATTTTSTTLPENTVDVDYYLLVQPPDVEQLKVELASRPVAFSESLSELLEPMFSGEFVQPDDRDDDGRQLINQVPAYEFVRVRRPDDSNVATVELETFDDPGPGNSTLRDVAAQLVFTLTSFSAVESVAIEIDGERASLPTTNAEGNTDEPVDRDDYALYDPDFVPSTSTTAGN